MNDRDTTYSDRTFLKDLRYARAIVPAQFTERLAEGGNFEATRADIIYLKPPSAWRSAFADAFGYWGMFALGYASGAVTILCLVGR